MERIVGILGGLGLFCAVAVDFCSVIGRHLGHPVAGSIELMQACIVMGAGSAIVAATLAGKHAAVRMLLERLAPSNQRRLRRIHSALSIVLFAALSTATAWLIADLVHSHEESELLHIPWLPLRLLCFVAVAVVTVLELKRLIHGDPR